MLPKGFPDAAEKAKIHSCAGIVWDKLASACVQGVGRGRPFKPLKKRKLVKGKRGN